MAFKLVRFVEDLIWHISPKSEVKISKENDNITVSAKYGKYFYPALLINEGTKEELRALKKRYIQQDKILQKYYKFIPYDDSNKINKNNIVVEDVKIRSTHINRNQATQTDAESTLIPIKTNSIVSDDTLDLKEVSTQTSLNMINQITQTDCVVPRRTNCIFCHDTLDLKNVSTQTSLKNIINQNTQTDYFMNVVPSRTNCTLCHENPFINTTSQTLIQNMCAEQGTQTDFDLNFESSNNLCDLNNDNSTNKSLSMFVTNPTDVLAHAMTNTDMVITSSDLNDKEKKKQKNLIFVCFVKPKYIILPDIYKQNTRMKQKLKSF